MKRTHEARKARQLVRAKDLRRSKRVDIRKEVEYYVLEVVGNKRCS